MGRHVYAFAARPMWRKSVTLEISLSNPDLRGCLGCSLGLQLSESVPYKPFDMPLVSSASDRVEGDWVAAFSELELPM